MMTRSKRRRMDNSGTDSKDKSAANKFDIIPALVNKKHSIEEKKMQDKLAMDSNDNSAANKFDIISVLVKNNLNSIVWNMFSLLEEQDLLNAVTANPNQWVVPLIKRSLTDEYFVDRENTSWLPILMSRRWQQMRHHQTRNVNAILREACSDYSKLNRNAKRQDGDAGYRVQCPFNFPNWSLYKLHVGSDYIVQEFYSEIRENGRNERKYMLLVFDRWTLEFINAFSGRGMMAVNLPFDAGSQLLTLHSVRCYWDEGDPTITIVLNVATGRARTIELEHFESRRYSDRLLLCTSGYTATKQEPVTVYKLERDGQPVLVQQTVTMPESFRWMRGDANNGCVALHINSCSRPQYHQCHDSSHAIEIRSKRDFSLIRTLSYPWAENHPFYLLSESFVARLNVKERAVEVRSLLSKELPVVYRFLVSGRNPLYGGCRVKINVINTRYLALTKDTEEVLLWQLPLYFLQHCWDHLENGTVGEMKSECRAIKMRHIKGLTLSCCVHKSQSGITRVENKRDRKRTKSEMSVELVFHSHTL